MKNILGLDLGTNSIGWALVSYDENSDAKPQIKIGSRIIPMSQDVLGKFDSGVTESQTAQRTGYRGVRRIRERNLQRRERLFRILHILGFLPEHFDKAIGWDKQNNHTYGKFLDHSEPKIAWRKNALNRAEFVFMSSFEEMLEDFHTHQPDIVADGKKVPYDWTLYFLRKKALSRPISKQELAWIILSFNQKRGYYQLRGEDEEETNSHKREEYYTLKVVKVEATDQRRGNDIWYNIHLENGWIYRRSSKQPLNDWEGKIKEFIITTEYEDDGSVKKDRDGIEKRSFRAPKEDDWALQKKRAESDITLSGQTVGAYIYDHILANPSEKVRGKLVRVVERKFYKEELIKILEKQKEYIPELTDASFFEKCIKELYAQNTNHQESLRRKDLINLIANDLIFYQRPLKSKRSLISDCPYEQYEYINKETGEVKVQHIKCIAKSNPFYQEFRLWQFVHNLRLYQRDDLNNTDVTQTYLPTEEDYVRLFTYLNDKKEINQDTLLKEFFLLKKPKGKDTKFPLRWNYIEDKAYPCNATRATIMHHLQKADVDTGIINDRNEEYRLWHLLYSVDDKNELIKALKSYAEQKHLPETFVETFQKITPYKKEYGAYSEKAIKKLLTVMRMGSMWNEKEIPDCVNNILGGEIDEKIASRIQHNGIQLKSRERCKGLPEWLACYVVYGRHSEASDIEKWETPNDLQRYIRSFKQYSLRNPIVEQCLLETLRTVHDIWQDCGKIDEIHVELGRSMKSTSEQRKRDTERILKNENTNLRIKQLLIELKNDISIEDVRPYSPMQQEILRIYEEGALLTLNKDDADYSDIERISRLASPTQSELQKYKLWLEQKYCSPYTGQTISLTKLFTSAYQIEHIIPQGRYFDDSFSNKVICESEVNQRKSNMLGMEFIKNCGGEIIHCAAVGDVKVYTEEEYTKFVQQHYANNRQKASKLMMDDIPEEFLQRQMNDSRYISKVIIGLLSNVVRADGETEYKSKNIITCSGGITDRLKKDWGLKDVWNHIVSPRFERMNILTGSEEFGHWENKSGKRVFQTTMPLELQKGFSKKRIDHRHHAMDALVIALATSNIVNYLNNVSAADTKRREDLRQLLCDKNRIIRKPWNTFTEDSYRALQNVIISFKHYIRVINKGSNYYEHYNVDGKKVIEKQKRGDQWVVRKPLHKETVFGRVNLKRTREVAFSKAIEQPENIASSQLRQAIVMMKGAGMTKQKINAQFKSQNYVYMGRDYSKVLVYYFTDEIEPLVATRKMLDNSFDEKKIMSITDTGIQKILLSYLAQKGNDPKLAFSPEGIMEMNANIRQYNGGKDHKPIIRVRVSEPKGEKYSVGVNGINSKKFVEAQSGTNLYFAIYENKDGVRSYQTIQLNIVVERLKQGLLPVPEKDDNGIPLKFYLSPNDLVYVPTEDEILSEPEHLDFDRIYKFVSATGNRSYFIKHNIAAVIQNKVELFSLNKMEKTMDNSIMIKSVCWKLETDRLGHITKIIK
ncbi:MAG: type II CRISPR RNA-guided endonuclease Cas9 [Prevotella sp.]|nr:type II CRISPR RNA-guided endonuclease Cas9 [Prevotella sp.]